MKFSHCVWYCLRGDPLCKHSTALKYSTFEEAWAMARRWDHIAPLYTHWVETTEEPDDDAARRRDFLERYPAPKSTQLFMTHENAAQYLPLVQALADKKTIQLRNARGEWDDCLAGVVFSFPPDRYRVKPQPRHILLDQDSQGRLLQNGFNSRPFPPGGIGYSCVEFVEVLK